MDGVGHGISLSGMSRRYEGNDPLGITGVELQTSLSGFVLDEKPICSLYTVLDTKDA